MSRKYTHMVGGATLVLALGIGTQAYTYASPAHAAKKTVLAKQSGNKFVFTPAKTTVKAGTTVVWQNSSIAPHTVTSETKSWKYNKLFMMKKSVSYKFTKPGTYKYKCTLHPGQVGTIVVTK